MPIPLSTSRLFAVGTYLLYLFFCWLMLQITMQYIPYNSDVAFLRIKQDVVSIPVYLPTFYLHVYSSMLVLLAGFTQFSKCFRSHFPFWHRRLGSLYIVIVIFLSGPSGLLMGYYANGGWSSQLAFCLLAILWIGYTVIAWQKGRCRDWPAHRNFMIRSFALSLSALSLRLWKFGLVAAFAPRPMDVYRWVAWLGWVVNLLLAEWVIYKISNKKLTLFA